MAEIRRSKDTNGHLKTAFWDTIQTNFNLKRLTEDLLPDPAEDAAGPRAEIQTVLSWVHSENPATRRIEPLDKFLEYCDQPLTYSEYFGIIHATMECATVSHTFMSKAHLALMKYMLRRPNSL